MESPESISFSDFPEDVQLNILSFLTPGEISSFASTSRRSAALSASDGLWSSMLRRRWGFRTPTHHPRRLYASLDRWEPLLGFWRRVGPGPSATPPLLLFEWGPSSITGSRISPSPDPATYQVLKTPFLWLGLSPLGRPLAYFQSSESDLVEVNLSFLGPDHFAVDEIQSSSDDPGALEELAGTSPPDRLTLEIYQYFANRTSPIGDKASRRQRRKERERSRTRRWESEHFLKISNCYPTPDRPLQGIWKGINVDMRLEFYLVVYDDAGGVICRRAGDAKEPFSGHSPVFWTPNTKFLQPPFSIEEQELYSTREHFRPLAPSNNVEWDVVSRILHINSSYDLVIPDLTGSSGDPRKAEGRIWEYESGTFCFGFLRNKFTVDLKHVIVDGRLLDTQEYYIT